MLGGLHIQYYVVCKRKLWLYSKNINLAPDNDKVLEGAVLHDRAYRQVKERDIHIDNQIQIDAIDKQYIREVKNSSKMIEADQWQLIFYLYELKKRGINKKGLIQYTKERKTEEIELTPNKVTELKKMVNEIEQIIYQTKPPKFVKKRYCKSCAYHDFCFAGEESE
ncbi:CRISPR-associated protein Cas4 [Sporolactobacillus sp. THM19-2]|uniref:CRISPR-associated protein Cas4 n=1 Tax=Sporolactobacillus sp. THM19-2 TaxID=2511171 RepID=UPI00101F24EB|nr:CRISPR-associated protein Cas4 [Sporolactobacillus sp. THM19-2]RYL93713.1 CRISPR-associated protein Cas4 [Sporolactobacillus sp. THM19-2]